MQKLEILLLLLFGAAFPAQSQGFTEQELATITACEENISGKNYSPEKADNCLAALNGANKDFKLLDKLRAADEAKAAYILTYENAIKDLGNFLDDAGTKYVIRNGLIARLEQNPCPLCDLGLGPQPEQLFPWMSRYSAQNLDAAKKAVRAWDTLAPATAALLTGDGVTPETWRRTSISAREAFLKTWATEKLNGILPPGATGFDPVKHDKTVQAISEYLDIDQRARIQKAIRDSTDDIKKSGRKNDNFSMKYEKMRHNMAGLSALSENGQRALLDETFDNAAPGAGKTGIAEPRADFRPGKNSGAGGAAPVYTLTDAEAARIGPRLQNALLAPNGEISGTPTGRDVLAFYNKPGTSLEFRVEDLKTSHMRGKFTPPAGIKINKAFVEEAMKKNGVTANRLLDEKDDDAMQKVARFTAPTFIHEWTHLRQRAWARENKVPEYYYLDHETEAFSKGALFALEKSLAEKQKGNLRYSNQISEGDVQTANLLKKEGTGGVQRSIMYYLLPSQEGQAAQTFARHEPLKKESSLPAIGKPVPGGGTQTGHRDTAALRREFNDGYEWYKLAVKKSGDDALYFQNALADLLARETGRKNTVEATIVPELK